MIEIGTISETIYFLLSKIGPTDKLKLVKLIYFADKYHVIKYGRTITNDEYWAMDHGPVRSNVRDVLEFNDFTMSKSERKFASKLIYKISKNRFKKNNLKRPYSYNYLSKTDIEALNFVISKFGSMRTWDIRDYSHAYPEWAQYKEMFKNNEIRREKIQTDDLISIIHNDQYFPFKESDIEEAKDIFCGNY